MAAPEIEVVKPRLWADCDQCDGEIELLNIGGKISSVNDLEVVALGRVSLAGPNDRDGCLFRPTPLFGGNPQEFERRIDLGFGLPFAHSGERDVRSGEIAAEIDLGTLLERVTALLLDVSSNYIEVYGVQSNNRDDPRSLMGCIFFSARISVRITYSAANGAQGKRTYTYSLVDDRQEWKLVPLSGDIPMWRFGEASEDDTHEGLIAHLKRIESGGRDFAFRTLVDFMSQRRMSN
jgi:hypothetical protein